MEEAESWAEFRDSFGTLIDVLRRGYLEAVPPIPTGIAELDRHLGGGMRPGLHVLGGEPGAGKSALALNIAVRLAIMGRRVLYASLEMNRAECMARCCSMLSTSKEREAFRWCDWERLGVEAAARRDDAMRAGDAKGFTDDLMKSDPVGSALSLLMESCQGLCLADGEPLRALTGLLGAAERGFRAGMGLLIVDYMQRVDVEGAASEYERVSTVCRGLSAFGADHGIPVLALASLNRDALKGGAPSMFGIRGSGNAEYDAQSMMVLANDDGGEAVPDEPRRVLLHVTKARGGFTTADGIPSSFDGAHNLFSF